MTSILLAAVGAASLLLLAEGWAAGPADTQVVPRIEMEDVPLTTAIRDLARQARLNILLDPKLSEPPFRGLKVSVRWENVTAREALLALLDNYGLVLVESVSRAPSRTR